MKHVLTLRGVRTQNLKGVDVDLQAHSLVVITGVSGSGKTSLAVETLAAESQRRFIETFPTSARRLLERLERPDADAIGPLPPAIILRHSHTRPSRRATASTLCEIHSVFQQLYAAVGEIVCPACQLPVVAHTAQTIGDVAAEWPAGVRFQICFERLLEPSESPDQVASDLMEAGFQRVILNQQSATLKVPLPTDWPNADRWLVVVDRLQTGQLASERLIDSLEQALQRGGGACSLMLSDDSIQTGQPFELDNRSGRQAFFFTRSICPGCRRKFPIPTTRLFSYHSPLSACPQCRGTGEVGDITCSACRGNRLNDMALAVRVGGLHLGELLSQTVSQLRDLFRQWLDVADEGESSVPPRPGTPGRGVGGEGSASVPNANLVATSDNKLTSNSPEGEFTNKPAPSPPAPLPRVRGRGEPVSSQLPPSPFLGSPNTTSLALTSQPFLPLPQSALTWVTQLYERLTLLDRLGLGFLQLSRSARTLSSGEVRRLTLAATCAVKLVESLYVLDEPAAGMHPSEVDQLVLILRELQSRRNSLIVVEHSERLIRQADAVVDLGPGAGPDGGQVIHQGTPQSLLDCADSLTGSYLAGRNKLERRGSRNPSSWIKLRGIRYRNLKDLNIDVPLGALCAVTGPSGSGKSTLVRDTLYPVLCMALNQPIPAGDHGTIREAEGIEALRAVVYVDQSPPEKSGRGNVATTAELWGEVRALLAATPEAKVRQFNAGTFSFHNANGGRCPTCEGRGTLAVDLQFLADLHVTCSDCQGTRFQRDVLEVKYRGLNVAEILKLTISQSLPFFRGRSRLQRRLKSLKDVGLGYLQLGQPISSLSGGETQRLQLATQITTRPVGPTLYLLDEPARGLHPADIQSLVNWFDDLLNEGHSLVIIEHRPELIAVADHIIELS